MTPISAMAVQPPVGGAAATPRAEAAGGSLPFTELLSNALEQAGRPYQDMTAQLQQLSTGDAGNLQQLVLSMAQADLALEAVVEVRNQVVAAYQEVMRMQV